MNLIHAMLLFPIVMQQACFSNSGDRRGVVDGQPSGNSATLRSGNDLLDEDNSDQSMVPSVADDRIPDRLVLVLPDQVERIDIDRFVRQRRSMMVRHLPLEEKFENVHRPFGHALVVEKDVEASMMRDMQANPQLAHWLFLHGALTLQESLADNARPLLLEEQKALIAHFGRTLGFLARSLDQREEGERYKIFLRKLYVNLAGRHLYREVRPRNTPTPMRPRKSTADPLGP
jgi:hypothetical protein